jgi:outer membrane immunogenic protein
MRKFLTGGIALFALLAASSAQAANYNWNGFYVGGNVGYSWGKSDFDYSFGTAATSGVGSSKPKGVLGGLQGGYNWQNKQWLLGVEADFQLTGQKGDSLSLCGDPQTCLRTFFSATQKLPWFGTLRGRLGFASADDLLLYGTGGIAWGRVKTEVSGQNGSTVPFNSDASTTKTGWTLGAGVEKAFASNWSVKLEYLYLNLGTVSQTIPAAPGTLAINSTVKDNIVRVGVNRKF